MTGPGVTTLEQGTMQVGPYCQRDTPRGKNALLFYRPFMVALLVMSRRVWVTADMLLKHILRH